MLTDSHAPQQAIAQADGCCLLYSCKRSCLVAARARAWPGLLRLPQ